MDLVSFGVVRIKCAFIVKELRATSHRRDIQIVGQSVSGVQH